VNTNKENKVEIDYSGIKVLETADDVTDAILKDVEDCVGFFDDEPMGTEAFIDRLCKSYGGTEFDVESYDNAAVRKIMKHARSVR
jgi:hypothetical protein